MSADPNQALAGDLFNEADLNAVGNRVVVEEASYNVTITSRYTPKKGGIVFAEGRIADGPNAGKNVSLFSVVLHKSDGQKGIGLQNLGAVGIDLATLNQLSRTVGASKDNLDPLYKAIAELLNGRAVVAELVHNTYEGAQGETTDMQVVPGKMTLISAPQIAVGGAPAVPQAAPPVPGVAVPAGAPAAAPQPPVAEAPAPAAVAPAPAAPAAVAPAPAAPAAVPAPAAPAAVPAPAPVDPAAQQAPAAAAPVAAPVAPAVEAVPTADPGF